MDKLKLTEVKQYDKDHGTGYLSELEVMCHKYAIPGQGQGVWLQFKTDWVQGGIKYALRQTLRYVDYGYADAMVFKELGVVIWKILVAMGLETNIKT